MRSTLILVLALCPLFLMGHPFVKYHQTAGIADSISGHPWPNYPQWGCGVSCADFNGDGFDDLTVATGHGNRLLFYQNNGDGTFTKIPPMVKYKFHTKMVLWVDYDNDGDKDLFLTGWQHPNRLYRNDGGPLLTDVTAAAGLPISDDWTWGASFGDYNNDGHLDLYVCNREKDLYSNFLYKNNGDGTFTNVTTETKAGDETQLTFQSIFWDYNNDGYQDLYMANDRLYGNSLYKNNGFGV
ncbi:MAG: VCBS repeat-containing protein, partial [Phaeodactylibacter sp.]|nr:VCBS repeat-containing protein [Phaeodactylibacter sp.]